MAGELTDMQEAFCRAVADGMPQKEAARKAGYADGPSHALSVTASRNMRVPAIRARIFELREEKLSGDLVGVAFRTLRAVMEDETAPAAARISAVKFTLEAAGHGIENRRLALKAGEDGDKRLSDMSIAELEALVRAKEIALRSVNTPNGSDELPPLIDCEGVTS